LRIALVTEYFYPHLGGVTEHVQNLAVQFRRQGHAVTIVTSSMGPRQREEREVHRLGRSVFLLSNGSFARVTVGWGLSAQLEDLFRTGRFDIVHVHGALAPTLGLLAPSAAHKLGIAVVATFHSWFRRSLAYQTFRRPLQERLDRIQAKIAVSQPVVDAMQRYFETDWQIIPNGVNVDDFHPNGRRPMDAVLQHPRLLFLGRLDPRNGLNTVIDAMPRILARYPQAELVVVGDGPLRGYYERQTRRLKGRVRFVGRVYRERPAYYGESDLYLCPTDKASFGITLLEAMACGTPMIVSDVPGFRELVDGGSEAVLVPPGNAAAWADTVVELLEDPARRAVMGQAGLDKVAHYSWEVVVDRVMAVYRSVLR
jgi:phosphatidylinositol alpha-mannosyltransferase